MTTTEDDFTARSDMLIAVRGHQNQSDRTYRPFGRAGEPLAARSVRQRTRARFALTSMLLHGVAIGAVMMSPTQTLETRPPDERAVELVFAAAEKPEPPKDPAPESQPARQPLPEAQPDKATEPVSEQPRHEAPRSPEPSPPKPIPLPAKTLVKSAATEAVPRPVQPTPIVSPPRAVPIAPSATTAAAVPASTAAAPLIDPAWQASVVGWLASRKTYPEEARRRGEEGRVAVRFTIDRSGQVVAVAIVGASGSERLDDAALTLLRQAPLPAFPVSMTQARITITTTIRYSLR